MTLTRRTEVDPGLCLDWLAAPAVVADMRRISGIQKDCIRAAHVDVYELWRRATGLTGSGPASSTSIRGADCVRRV